MRDEGFLGQKNKTFYCILKMLINGTKAKYDKLI